MSDLVVMPINKIKKKCICCGKEFELPIYADKDFCDRCFIVICKELYNKANDNLTIKQLRDRIKVQL